MNFIPFFIWANLMESQPQNEFTLYVSKPDVVSSGLLHPQTRGFTTNHAIMLQWFNWDYSPIIQLRLYPNYSGEIISQLFKLRFYPNHLTEILPLSFNRDYTPFIQQRLYPNHSTEIIPQSFKWDYTPIIQLRLYPNHST